MKHVWCDNYMTQPFQKRNTGKAFTGPSSQCRPPAQQSSSHRLLAPQLVRNVSLPVPVGGALCTFPAPGPVLGLCRTDVRLSSDSTGRLVSETTTREPGELTFLRRFLLLLNTAT